MSELISYSGGELSLGRSPDTVLAEASLVAKAVDRLVKSRPDLVQVIGGRKHPRFELLQIVGSMFRVTARVRETRQLVQPDGWEAIAEAYHVPTGQVVATGEGMCSTDEPDWAVRPKYEWRNGRREKVGEVPVTSHQRRSMAQTRACSKALRLALGWVLGLAGYEATAAEEMSGAEETPAQPAKPLRKSAKQAPDAKITADQAKALWSAARAVGLSEAEVAELLQAHGYQRTADVRALDYQRLLDQIAQRAQSAAKPQSGSLPALDFIDPELDEHDTEKEAL
jgi:hypothetical protein